MLEGDGLGTTEDFSDANPLATDGAVPGPDSTDSAVRIFPDLSHVTFVAPRRSQHLLSLNAMTLVLLLPLRRTGTHKSLPLTFILYQ